jgi:hypothetical protein
MIIRNLANKVSFPSTPLDLCSRGHLAYKTDHLSLINHYLQESGYSLKEKKDLDISIPHTRRISSMRTLSLLLNNTSSIIFKPLRNTKNYTFVAIDMNKINPKNINQ